MNDGRLAYAALQSDDYEGDTVIAVCGVYEMARQALAMGAVFRHGDGSYTVFGDDLYIQSWDLETGEYTDTFDQNKNDLLQLRKELDRGTE